MHIQTFPLACGIPSAVSLTPPSMAASAKLYPEMASIDDFRCCMRVMHRSIRIVICSGSATEMQRRHQAADKRAAGAGCTRTETTGSMIPRNGFQVHVTTNTIQYLGVKFNATNNLCNSLDIFNIKQSSKRHTPLIYIIIFDAECSPQMSRNIVLRDFGQHRSSIILHWYMSIYIALIST